MKTNKNLSNRQSQMSKVVLALFMLPLTSFASSQVQLGESHQKLSCVARSQKASIKSPDFIRTHKTPKQSETKQAK